MQNILLIEDEENLNRGISLKLKKEGYTVFSASTVTEGLYTVSYTHLDVYKRRPVTRGRKSGGLSRACAPTMTAKPACASRWTVPAIC